MCTGGGDEWLLDSDVQLRDLDTGIENLEPAAPTLVERRWLVDLHETEPVPVEAAREILAAARHGDLYVVQQHGTSSRRQ